MSRLHNYKPLILLFFFSFCFFAGGQIARIFPPASVRTDDKSPSGNAASSGTVPTASTSGNPLSTILPAAENWGLSFQEEGKVPVGNASFDELQQYHAYYAQKTDKKVIYLTFDCGYENGNTPAILNALKRHNVQATFFVVGNRVNAYSKVLKASYNMGNQIASHTFDHEDLSKMTKKQLSAEMTKTNNALQSVIGCHATLVRPPYGNISDVMRKNIKIPMMYWSIDTDDWKWRNAAKVLAECKNVKDGDIILMHDLYPSTAEAVKKLVPRLKKKGYELVTVDEMFYYKGIKAEAGKVYASGRQ